MPWSKFLSSMKLEWGADISHFAKILRDDLKIQSIWNILQHIHNYWLEEDGDYFDLNEKFSIRNFLSIRLFGH